MLLYCRLERIRLYVNPTTLRAAVALANVLALMLGGHPFIWFFNARWD